MPIVRNENYRQFCDTWKMARALATWSHAPLAGGNDMQQNWSHWEQCNPFFSAEFFFWIEGNQFRLLN